MLGTAAGLSRFASNADCARPKSNYTKLEGKIVLVTGASAGIGESCAWKFAEHNSKIILVGRRLHKLEQIRNEIKSEYPKIRIHLEAMDVQNTDACMALPQKLPKEWKNVDILVNNAGLALGAEGADTNVISQGQQMMDTNVMGVIAMTRAFLPGMLERNSGHVINMSSIAASMAYVQGSMYCASKAAVERFTQCAMHDLKGTPIRMTGLSPGLVGNTEFSNVRFGDDKKAESVYKDIVALHPDDIADDVIYVATRPAHVNVADLKVFCTNQSGPKDAVKAGPNLGAK
jgi:3-hydroxy acid dehydrogenase / malonic semialdehyde reductase